MTSINSDLSHLDHNSMRSISAYEGDFPFGFGWLSSQPITT